MVTIKRNGENFAKEIQNVGQTLLFEGTGCKCEVLKYYKSQPKTEEEKKARPLGGNKTQVTIKWENGKDESFNTDELRAKHCPDYVTKPHKPQEFRFEVKNPNLATREEAETWAKWFEERVEEFKREEEANREREAITAVLSNPEELAAFKKWQQQRAKAKK